MKTPPEESNGPELGLILLKGVENEISPFAVQSGYDNSPTLGKFTQPDSIIPGLTNSQAWNRYSYVLNSPVMYVDPSGHVATGAGEDDLCLPGSSCDPGSDGGGGSGSIPLVTFDEDGGAWKKGEQDTIRGVAEDVANRFAETYEYSANYRGRALLSRFDLSAEEVEGMMITISSAAAWYAVYDGPVLFTRKGNRKGAAGETISRNHIHIFTPIGREGNVLQNYLANNPGYIVHELGHAFDNALCEGNSTCLSVFSNPGRSSLPNSLLSPDHGNSENGFWGFAGGWDVWQYGWNRGDEYGPGEIFADMFLGWTYNSWQALYQPGFSLAQERSTHMDASMSHWLSQLIGE